MNTSPLDPLAAARGQVEGPDGPRPAGSASAPDEPRAREEALRRRVEELEERCQEAQAGMARYRELFEFAPDCYLVTDFAANILEANQAAAVLFRRPRAFLIGKPLPFLLAPQARPDFYTRLAHLAVQPSSVAAWQAPLPEGNNGARVAALSLTVVGDRDGRPCGLRWLVRDVTESRRAEEGLREAKRFADELLQVAGAAILIVGPGGELLRANAYLEALCGYCRDELAALDWCALLLGGPAEPEARDAFLRDLAYRARSQFICSVRARFGPPSSSSSATT